MQSKNFLYSIPAILLSLFFISTVNSCNKAPAVQNRNKNLYLNTPVSFDECERALLSYSINPKTSLIEIKIKVNKQNDITTAFVFSKRIGLDSPGEIVKDIKAFSNDGSRIFVRSQKGKRWIVEHNGKPFTLSYTVVPMERGFFSGWANLFGKKNNSNIAQKEDDHLFMYGFSVLMYPERIESSDFNDIPVSLTLHSTDFLHMKTNIEKDKLTLSLSEVLDSVVVAGDYITESYRLGDRNSHIILCGKEWTFKNSEFFKRFSAITETHDRVSKIFKSSSTLIILREGSFSTPITRKVENGFIITADSDTPLKDLEIAFAKNYLEQWRTRSLVKTDREHPQVTFSWFTRGFGDYLTIMTLYQSGNMTESDFLRKMDQLHREYLDNPYAFSASLRDIAIHYREDGDYKKLSRQKGALLAFIFDTLIREKSNDNANLFNFIHFLRIRHLQSGKRFTGREIVEAIEGFVDLPGRSFYDDFIDSADPIPFKEYVVRRKCVKKAVTSTGK